MARLIRTEKEVEGRREEVWLVVEEDALEQWPAGPLDVVGKPAPRVDGPERVRGEATFTADIQLPGMLHAAVLRSPHAHARVTRIDLAAALAAPGVRAAIGPGDVEALRDECGYEGVAVAAVCAETRAQADAAVALIDVEWEVLRRCSTPTRRSRAARSSTTREQRARRRRARPRRGGRRRRGDLPHADRAAQLDGDARLRLPLGRRHARGLHLDAGHLGRPRAGRGELGLPPTTCASSASSWAAASAPRPTRATTR